MNLQWIPPWLPPRSRLSPLRRLDERLRRGGQDQHRPPRTRGRRDDLHALRGTAELRALLQGAEMPRMPCGCHVEPTGERSC